MAEVGKRQISWQGGEHDFCLSAVGDILAVEQRCGAGLAAIYKRLAGGDWGIEDVRQPIRFALIGGGMPAKEADALVDVGVLKNPRGLGPSVVLAMACIEAVLVGVPDDPVGKKGRRKPRQARASSTRTAASAAQPSSESAPA